MDDLAALGGTAAGHEYGLIEAQAPPAVDVLAEMRLLLMDRRLPSLDALSDRLLHLSVEARPSELSAGGGGIPSCAIRSIVGASSGYGGSKVALRLYSPKPEVGSPWELEAATDREG